MYLSFMAASASHNSWLNLLPWPRVKFEEIEGGVISRAERDLEEGRKVEMIVSWLIPNTVSVPSLNGKPGRSALLSITVPVDDTHTRVLVTYRMKRGLSGVMHGTAFEEFKPWHQMTIEERQDSPGDYEAQAGQGAIPFHSEEHLVTSDRWLGIQRRMLKQEIEKVAQGGDPVGVSFSAEHIIHVPSGHFYF